MAASLQIHPGNMPKLLSLDLSNKKPYQLHGLSNTMQNASNTKNLNLSNTEVKSAGEMDKGQRLEPERMCVDRNPPCTTFPDKSTNIRAIRECFPKLLRLDGQELPSPVIIDVDTPYVIKPCKESYKGFETLKSMIL
eukprot:bmy_22353T0